MLADFQLAGGSVAGKDHRKGVPKNRQDDFLISVQPETIIAIVSDGCGSGERSEVGASIAIRLFNTYLNRHLSTSHKFDQDVLIRAQRDLVAELHVLAREMGQSLSEVVNRYFLFTLLGVVITDEYTTFFALGDGLIVVNCDLLILEPEDGNQPVYLGYALTGSTLTDSDPSKLDFQIVRKLPTAELNHFLIGTDGATDLISRADHLMPGRDEVLGGIEQFWTEDIFFSNKAAIERRLNLAARDWQRAQPTGAPINEGGFLPDDTTVIVGRRIPVPPAEE